MANERRARVENPPLLAGEKTCSKCGVTKDVSDYYLDKTNRTGLRAECKACCCKRANDWYVDHPEQVKAWNNALGLVGDSPEVLKALAVYLETHKGGESDQ